MGNGQGRGKLLKRAGLVILVGACAMLMLASQAKAVIIDHFENDLDDDASADSFLAVSNTNTVEVSTQTGLSNVLGGKRKATLTWLKGAGSTSSTAEAINNSPPAHYLDLSNGSDARSTLVLLYDGDAGSGNLGDLTVGGTATQLIINLLKADINASIKVRVEDAGGDVGIVTLIAASPVVPPGIPFVFNHAAFGALVDFTNVKNLTITLTDDDGLTDAVDFQIDSIESSTVPEPLTILGMVFGLGSVGAYIRKRRMA